MDEIERFKERCAQLARELREKIEGEHGWSPSISALSKVRVEGSGVAPGAVLGELARLGPATARSSRVKVKVAQVEWEQPVKRAIEVQGLSVWSDGEGVWIVESPLALRLRARERAGRFAQAAVEGMREQRRKARAAMRQGPQGLDERSERLLTAALGEGEKQAREIKTAGSRI